MRRIVTILLILFSTSGFSQNYFTLTPEGFKNKEKDFVVIEIANKTAKELFQQTKIYISSIYRSPKDVMSEVNNKIITVNGFDKKRIRRNSLHVFDIDYTVVFRFKDNKIRIDAPSFKLTTFSKGHQELHLVWTKFSLTGTNLGIYGKKNKLKSKKAKEDLEKFFNTYFEGVIKSLNSKEEEW